MPPVVDVDNEAFHCHGDERRIGNQEQRPGSGASEQVTQAKHAGGECHQCEDEAANPPGVKEHAEVDMMHVF